MLMFSLMRSTALRSNMRKLRKPNMGNWRFCRESNFPESVEAAEDDWAEIASSLLDPDNLLM